MFEIIRTIYSNSERSEQFLKQNTIANGKGTIKMPIATNDWDLKPTGTN